MKYHEMTGRWFKYTDERHAFTFICQPFLIDHVSKRVTYHATDFGDWICNIDYFAAHTEIIPIMKKPDYLQ